MARGAHGGGVRGPMTLQGDLSTLDLADLLQNLELHQSTGLLTLESDEHTLRLYFRDGKVTLLASDDRPSLMDVLVAAGAVSAETLEKARRKRRGSHKSLGETLVAMKAIGQEALAELARDRLVGDICEVVSAGTGEFTYEEAAIPRDTFDAEERKLGLELPVGPTLLEAARRADHWKQIRSKVPSDGCHYRVVQRARRPAHRSEDALTGALIALLDGTRSVSEVMAAFPHKRFDAYERLADLVHGGQVRALGAEDLAKVARKLAQTDAERAWEIVGRGLALHSQQPNLLEVQAELAQQRGEPESAVDGLKVLAHLRWESGDLDEARAALEQARELDPDDPALWERSMDLALGEERHDQAVEHGLRLAALLRAPGLHKKAQAVFERLLEVEPQSWQLVRERASSQVACGELDDAVQGLEAFAEGCLAEQDYGAARAAYEEVLAHDPSRVGATDALEGIESGEFERRAQARQKLARRVLLWTAVGLAVLVLALESAGRRAYRHALLAVQRRELLEQGRYGEAARLIGAVAERHPFTSTAWFDVGPLVAELRRKAEAAPPRPPAPRQTVPGAVDRPDAR